eukprot:CAMPEP_0172545930 /NCGR_PEP_ID=MMETSP1067-20121228/15767_1 /TAXON_ID=265564 ORGANISM="Thalassiosira punctigera, Strain Tpunct2005C2" /NCGR_SAMPLE_ID=MMETSP1067 /ASSEMBLY_ACC=CAM_ASM_000444 /LENGTH=984 /DNA_ID=CAMNT_0013332767 /DNA_START=290 /DNA_END=3244 /DNA_ORIENTATION=+
MTPGKAILAGCCYAALAAKSLTTVEARSWWSLEIPALENIRDADPLYGPSSTLLVEDTGFLYGSFQLTEDDVKSSFEFDKGGVTESPPPSVLDPSPSTSHAMQDAEEDLFAAHPTPVPSVIDEGEDQHTPVPSVIEEEGQEQPQLQSPSPVTSSPVVVTATPSSTTRPSPGGSIRDSVTDAPTPVQMVGPFPPHPTASPISPTASPTPRATTAFPIAHLEERPTFPPSERFEAANGSCPPGLSLHRLWMYDSASDGWGSTRLVIRGATGGADDSGSGGAVVFVGTLDVARGVVERESGVAAITSVHDEDRQRDDASDPRRRRLGTTLAGSFSRHGGTAAGAFSGLSDEETGSNKGPSMADGFQNAPNVGVVTGSENDISLGDPYFSDGGDADQSYEESGRDDYAYLCLSREDACYTAEVSGGTFLEEVRWEITRVEMGTGENIGLVAEGVGGGSGTCDFSLDDSCVMTCDGTAQISPPTSSPTAASLSQSPSKAPVATPTQSPSIFRSKKPATTPPSDILPQDNNLGFGIEEYRRIRDVLLSASPSSEAALADEGSPQSRAFDWIYGSNASGISDRRLVQRWVLASFYYGANGDEWIVKTGWMEAGEDECRWYGVSCLAGIISKLELEQNRLVGEIVPEVAVWRHYLYVLSLGNDYGAPEEEKNRFVMPVPSFLGDLTYLSFLNLEGVGMTSTIPETLFSSWPHLQSLYLNNNDITGSLPTSIRHLGSIEVLWLGGNNLGGSIVPEIGQLSTLKDLSLESNYREDAAGKRGFITTVPSEIGQLTNLEVLSLADNALSGQVPKLDDLISLRRLQLSGNFFEGQLPPAWGRLEMLEELDISFNWLSSTIPAEYGNMISLTSLSLNSNYNDNDGYFTWGIKGKLPIQLGKLKNLQHINLSNNYLTGTLTTEIGQLYLLQTMNLQNNFLQGPIPPEYSNSVTLKEILLQDNNIDGESFGMPEEICRLPDLELARVDCDVSCSCCLTTC